FFLPDHDRAGARPSSRARCEARSSAARDGMSLRLDRCIAGGLALATCLLRLPRLRALPVFGDEAMNLHWGQLVRQDFRRFAFVSLQDPKPPLHFWLLAWILPVFRDPVFAGRLFSLLCGAASAALFYVLARDLARTFGAETSRARLEAICGGVLFVLCPFAAFHQRMALTESLFLLEALTVAWLSLRAAAAAVDRRPIGDPALALGLALAAAMLTRQDFSYALWALPLFAWA